MAEGFEEPDINLGQENKKNEGIYRSTKVKLGSLFKSYPTGKDRIDEIKSRFVGALGSLENREEILRHLDECEQINSKIVFIDKIFDIIRPAIDLMIEKPELFEAGEGGQSEERGIQERVEINEILSYSVEGDFILIHAIPKIEVKNILTKTNEGLSKLAEIVNERKEIEVVEMASWIVTKHPNIVKRSGFELDGEISKDFRDKYFHDDNAIIHKAHMGREDFLEKYLKK